PDLQHPSLSLPLLRPPPPPTPLPYTTLFRSRLRGAARPVHHHQAGGRREPLLPAAQPHRRDRGLDRLPERAAVRRARDREHGEQDRKSTRLNSSHQIISYAVFCLQQQHTIKI